MIDDFDYRDSSLFGSVVFRPTFNTFELINPTQAWSLLFTGGREDKTLGLNPKVGRRFTTLLFAMAALGIFGVVIVQTRLLA
jgi:hypothetical protein